LGSGGRFFRTKLRASPTRNFAPFVVAATVGWFALDSIPVLRVSSSFPVTTVWLRQLQLDSVELVGSCILFEAHNPRPKLSIEERASAAYCRARIMEEIDELPVHLET